MDTTATTMEDRIVLLCHLNNVGFQQLVSGHLESAQTVFATAIRAAKGLVDCDDWNGNRFAYEESPPESESSPLESLVQSCVINMRCAKENDVTDGASTFTSSQHDGAFVYRRAFKLCHDERTPPLGTICNVILYNMVSKRVPLNLYRRTALPPLLLQVRTNTMLLCSIFPVVFRV